MGGSSKYAVVKEWRKNNPSARAEEARRWRARHPELAKEIKQRYRAKSREERLPREAAAAQARRLRDPEGQKRRSAAYQERQEARRVDIAGRPRPNICELCGEAGRTVFDHCHNTGQFRGWICDRCNKVLGLVYDSAELLMKMREYLGKANK